MYHDMTNWTPIFSKIHFQTQMCFNPCVSFPVWWRLCVHQASFILASLEVSHLLIVVEVFYSCPLRVLSRKISRPSNRPLHHCDECWCSATLAMHNDDLGLALICPVWNCFGPWITAWNPLLCDPDLVGKEKGREGKLITGSGGGFVWGACQGVVVVLTISSSNPAFGIIVRCEVGEETK